MILDNNKGFTVIELILSFALVMFLAVAMFALVNNYRNREQEESIRRDLLTLQNTLTQDIYQDTVDRKVDSIDFCRNNDNSIIKQCIDIKFLDGVEKELKVVEDVIMDGHFEIPTFYILYGGVKYDNPDPKFANVVDDYILTSSIDADNLEYGVIYHIKLRIEHQDLDDEFVIDVVTTGVK